MKIKVYLPAILWACTIFLLCHLPGKDLPHIPIVGIDKLIHLFLFFILTYLFLKASTKSNHLKKTTLILWIFLILFYGIALELYQGAFVVGRQADPFDAIANGLGVFSAIFLYKLKKE